MLQNITNMSSITKDTLSEGSVEDSISDTELNDPIENDNKSTESVPPEEPNSKYIMYDKDPDQTDNSEFIICNADMEPSDFLPGEPAKQEIEKPSVKKFLESRSKDGPKSTPKSIPKSIPKSTPKPKPEVENETNPEQKKRGMPSSMLANQQKYAEVRDKQLKVLENMKKSGKQQSTSTKSTKSTKSDVNITLTKINSGFNADTQGSELESDLVRINVGGKVRYVPQSQETINSKKSTVPDKKVTPRTRGMTDSNDSDRSVSSKSTRDTNDAGKDRTRDSNDSGKSISKIRETNDSSKSISRARDSNDSNKSISRMRESNDSSKSISRTRDMDNSVSTQSLRNRDTKNMQSSNGRMPDRYAKEIEKTVKVSTSKNVKNFTDLRRVKMLENLDTSVDAKTASMNELRRLKMDNRRRELEESKKKAPESKKESAVQQIVNNEQMSKFSKAIAIKNLSTSSRAKIRQGNAHPLTIANKKAQAEI